MFLEIKDLSLKYPIEQGEIFNNLNFTVNKGEFVCVIGPSGCGKTTLLNTIGGFVKATDGKVLLNGKVVDKPGVDRNIIFQEPSLFPWMSVIENIIFPMKESRKTKNEKIEIATKYLKMVQLFEYRDYPISKLSGGMKQRVVLARALATEGDIILMDEPFSALDKQTINILREKLEEIWLKTNKTIIYVTHSVEEALFFADKIILLSKKPSYIKEIYQIDIDRPRKITDLKFINLRDEILNKLIKEAINSSKTEYDRNI